MGPLHFPDQCELFNSQPIPTSFFPPRAFQSQYLWNLHQRLHLMSLHNAYPLFNGRLHGQLLHKTHIMKGLVIVNVNALFPFLSSPLLPFPRRGGQELYVRLHPSKQASKQAWYIRHALVHISSQPRTQIHLATTFLPSHKSGTRARLLTLLYIISYLYSNHFPLNRAAELTACYQASVLPPCVQNSLLCAS